MVQGLFREAIFQSNANVSNPITLHCVLSDSLNPTFIKTAAPRLFVLTWQHPQNACSYEEGEKINEKKTHMQFKQEAIKII